MTDDTSPPPSNERIIGFWSFVTTDESVARGQVNFWAMLETIVAIATFWWLTLTVETWTFFYASLFVAPLLLLRSEASVQLGVRWFETGFFGVKWPEDPAEKRAAQKRFERRALLFGVLLGLATGAVIAYLLSATFLVSSEEEPPLLRGVAIGAITTLAAGAGAVAGAVAGAGAGTVVAAVALAIAGAGALAIAGVTAGALAGAGAGVAAGIGALVTSGTIVIAGAAAGANTVTGAGAIVIAVATVIVGATAGSIFGYKILSESDLVVISSALTGAILGAFIPIMMGILFMAILVIMSLIAETIGTAESATLERLGAGGITLAGAVAALPYALGTWVATLMIRFVATFRHPIEGLVALPTNIRRLVLITAPGHAPELLPGLLRGNQFRLEALLEECRRAFASGNGESKIFAAILALIIPVWFLPGLAYRFILKSTMWLWWIGLFVGGAPDISGGVRGLKADHVEKWWRWALAAVSFVGLVTAFVVTVGPAAVDNGRSATPILPVLTFLVIFDLGSPVLLPILGTLNAATTIYLLGWAQSIFVDGRKGRDVESQMKAHKILSKLKSGVGAASLALIVLYGLLYANAVRHVVPVSPFFERFCTAIYGKYTKALLPSNHPMSSTSAVAVPPDAARAR